MYKDYQWEKMGSEDKKNVISVYVTMASWVILTAITAAAFDDDDDDPLKFKMENLAQNATQDYNPFDWVNALVQPTVVLSRIWALAKSIVEWFLEGVIQGKRVKTGPNAGSRRGWYQVKKGLPFFSSQTEWERYMESMFGQGVTDFR
jgi:hypothetical protein